LTRKAQALTEAEKERIAADRAAIAALADFSTRREERGARIAATAGGTARPAGPAHAGKPALTVIRGGLLAGACAAVLRVLQAHWRAATGTVATAALTVPLTFAAVGVQREPYESRILPASAQASSAPVIAQTAPSPGAARHHHAHRTVPVVPPSRSRRKAPPRTVPPPAAVLAGVAEPATPVLHAGADGTVMLVLTAEGGPACWTATATAPLVLHETPGLHCLADGESAGIPVTAPGQGTITVISGGQVTTVTVTVPAARSYGTMPTPASA